MIGFRLDDLFKDSHGVLFLVVRQPVFTVRNKKMVFSDENYVLTRVPDMIKYKSRYDGSEVTHCFPNLTITEELILTNIRKGVWTCLK